MKNRTLMVFLLSALPILIMAHSFYFSIDRLVKEFDKYKEDYNKKAEKYFFKYLKKNHGFGFNFYEIKKQRLEFTTIAVFDLPENFPAPNQISDLFQHLKLNKKALPLVLVSKNDQYFGHLLSYSDDSHPPYSLIVINDSNAAHLYPKQWYEKIRDFRPDLIFHISNTRLPFIMIKDNNYYLLGYFNGVRDAIVKPEDWVRDFEKRMGEKFQVLL